MSPWVVRTSREQAIENIARALQTASDVADDGMSLNQWYSHLAAEVYDYSVRALLEEAELVHESRQSINQSSLAS